MQTARNVAIILGLAALVSLAPGGLTARDTVSNIITVIFLGGLGFFAYRMYMENRIALFDLPEQTRLMLYGSATLLAFALVATGRMWDEAGPLRPAVVRADRRGRLRLRDRRAPLARVLTHLRSHEPQRLGLDPSHRAREALAVCPASAPTHCGQATVELVALLPVIVLLLLAGPGSSCSRATRAGRPRRPRARRRALARSGGRCCPPPARALPQSLDQRVEVAETAQGVAVRLTDPAGPARASSSGTLTAHATFASQR